MHSSMQGQVYENFNICAILPILDFIYLKLYYLIYLLLLTILIPATRLGM